MSSFKVPQPSPLETVLSLARAIVVGGPWALVPEEKWHAMHERHEADSEALRSALARVVEVEACCARLTAIIEDARPWVCCVPNEWPNDKVIDVKKRMDSVIGAELATARVQA